MKVCKYLLPCGKCDKFGGFCSTTPRNMEAYNRLLKEECDHHWVYQNGNATEGYYYCCKCGEHRTKL